MVFYTIRPLKVGSIRYYRGAFSSNQDDYKQREEFPCIIFLIEGNGRKILMDTGPGDPDAESMKASFHGPSARSPEEAPDARLRSIGVDPCEIDTVIMSHLHWDHCYNNHLFPQADFFVQKSELIDAVAPLGKFKTTYEAFYTGVVPPWARQNTRWKIIDGDYHLTDGIELIHIPGHSHGIMGALVETKKGPHFLPSDAVPLYDNLKSEEIAISGLCADLAAFEASLRRIRQMGAVIIPSHDPLTLTHQVFPD